MNALDYSRMDLHGVSNAHSFLVRMERFLRHFLSVIQEINSTRLVDIEYFSLSKQYPNITEYPVVFFLNYLPEMSVNPLGAPFLQHKLALQKLLDVSPKNMQVYIKEHPSQLYKAGGYQYLGRQVGFYRELLTNPRVRLLDNSMDSINILRNCRRVATISGSVGWQAIQLGIPAIVFGKTWYSDHPLAIPASNLSIEHFLEPQIPVESNLVDFVNEHFNKGLFFFYSKEEADMIGAPWNGEKTRKIFKKGFLHIISHS